MRHLWESCFEDSPQYLDYYMEGPFRECVVFTGGEPVSSMLHLHERQICWQHDWKKLHYIVGVSTLPAFRGRGMMRGLLRSALAWMYERQEPWTYLTPASEKIYLPFGFCTVSAGTKSHWTKDQWQQEPGDRMIPKMSESGKAQEVSEHGIPQAIPGAMPGAWNAYETLDDRQKELLASGTREKLFREDVVHIRRDPAYYEDLAREMQACRGRLMVRLDAQGEPVDYAAYGQEEDEMEVFDCLEGERTVLSGLGDEGWRYTAQIMARIVHLEAFVKSLTGRVIPDGVYRIQDPDLAANDGIWQIVWNGNAYEIRRMPNGTMAENTLDIAKLCAMAWSDCQVHLNELV